MDTIAIGVLIVVTFVVIFILLMRDDTVEYPASNGQMYRVYNRRSDESKRKAADILAELDTRMKKILENPDNKYQEDIKAHYSGTELRENLTEAYTVGKGMKIYLDLTPGLGDDGFYSIDLLTYVLMHEVSHIAVPFDGHDQKFWDIFKSLLSKASDLGVYVPIHGAFEYSGQTFTL
jgi:hypothetical protein